MNVAAPAGGNRPASASPIQRRYPAAPLVGAAAVVLDAAGAVLLIQRARPPQAGSWGLPGGLVDLGERLTDGAAREVKEECGIEVAIRAIVGAFEPIYFDAEGQVEYHYVVVDFWADYLSGQARPGDDAAAVAWVALADLEGYDLNPDTRRIIETAHTAWQAAHTGPV
jgi:ADP-ribose pyrophosphatase YjhB (NUDIX family)